MNSDFKLDSPIIVFHFFNASTTIQELTREQEKVKRTEKLLKEEHERGNSLLTRVKDLEIQNSSLRYCYLGHHVLSCANSNT